MLSKLISVLLVPSVVFAQSAVTLLERTRIAPGGTITFDSGGVAVTNATGIVDSATEVDPVFVANSNQFYLASNPAGYITGITITNDASQPAGTVVGGSPGTTFGIGTAGGGGGGSVNILTNNLVAIPATTNINFLTTSNSMVLVTNNAISVVPTMLFATNSVSGNRAEMRLFANNANSLAGFHFRTFTPNVDTFGFDTGCDAFQFGPTNWSKAVVKINLSGPFWQQLIQSTSLPRLGGWEYRVGSPAANVFTFGYMNSPPATNDYAVISCWGNPSMLLLSPTVINGVAIVSPRQPGKVDLGFHVVTIWTNINPHGINSPSSSPQHELQWYTRVGPIFPARQHYTIVGSNLTGVAFGRSHGLANDDAIFPTNRFGEVFFGTFGTATSNVVGFAGRDETNGLWYAYLSTNGNWITTYTRP